MTTPESGAENGSEQEAEKSPEISSVKKRSLFARVILGLGKTFFAVVLAIVTLLVAAAGFFFYTPEFVVSGEQIRSLTMRFLPKNMALDFVQAEILILRPEGMPFAPFAKEIRLEAKGLCFNYEAQAVHTCFDEISLALTGGWGGQRRRDEKPLLPRLIAIAPIQLLGGDASVDLPAFPPQEEEPKPEKEEGSSWLDLVRYQILPKWKIEGSRIEIKRFVLKTETDEYRSRFDLVTGEDGDTVTARLHEFFAASGYPRVDGVIRLQKPEGWGEANDRATGIGGPPRAWKVFLESDVDLEGAPWLRFTGDADITNWRSVDFRLRTEYKGIASLRETRVEALYSGANLDGKFSLKMGAQGSDIKAVDFVNCLIDVNLDEKIGGLRCGPQTVRLRVAERIIKNTPSLFILRPEFELRVNRVDFGGDHKGGEFTFSLDLAHMGFIGLSMRAEGAVAQNSKSGLSYDIVSGMDLRFERFSEIVKLLRATPYSVPAPVNALEGPLRARARVHLTDRGGGVRYEFQPNLTARSQAVNFTVSGMTDLIREAEGLRSVNDVRVDIEALKIAAPRMDLKAPPQLKPDSRFGPIPTHGEVFKAQTGEKPPLDFRMQVRTVEPQAIQILSNLTQAPVPIDLDLTYGGTPRAIPPIEEAPPTRGPASIDPRGPAALLARIPIERMPRRATAADPIQGYVRVGRTPVEIFRRKAVLETLRVDFAEAGSKRLDGRIFVHYLDYDINALLLGDASDPQVKFVSNPPLEDNQIISVLVFGRPLGELDDDQRTSVSNLNAAMADAVLGLGSLYFLASTPIESVGYDPERGMVTAKVGLGGGASLELGGGQQATGVGVRQRLGRNWTLRSDVERLGATGRRTVSAFIEWVRRF